MTTLTHDIELALENGVHAIKYLFQHMDFIEKASFMIADCLEKGGKILTAGNGGSLCDAMHFAEELTGQFRNPRKALGAICIADACHITCTANDMGFDQVFARGIEALGKKEDLFLGLTTSGNSKNLFFAFETAKKRGLSTIALLGKTGGKCKGLADLQLIIEGFETSDRIQEAHMCALHIIIEMVEKRLFGHA